MIFLASFFMILLMLVTASWFIIPLCVFITDLYKDITRSLHSSKPFPLGATLSSAFGVLVMFCFSAFGTLGILHELHCLWNSQKHPEEPEKTRNVLIQIPEKVQVHTEFRLDSTVIGKEVL